MQEFFLGEYIRQKRLDMHLSQEKLSDRICTPSTLSRIENGIQTPSRNVINALLERLGLPADRYFALLSDDETKIDALQKEIVSCNVHHEKERGLEKLHELEEITEKEDRLTRQFILRSKAILGKPDGEYSLEEKLQLLTDAIHMTVPRFELDEINSFLYTLNDVKIINQIALVYSAMGDHKKAADIYRQLLKYVEKHFENVLQSGGYLPLVAFNYARELDLCKRYEEAIGIAELGWQSCINHGHYQFLPDMVAVMAECYFYLNDMEKSENLYKQAYYIYYAVNKSKKALNIKKEAKEHLNIDL